MSEATIVLSAPNLGSGEDATTLGKKETKERESRPTGVASTTSGAQKSRLTAHQPSSIAIGRK